MSYDCRISLSAATQLRGAAGLVGRNWRLVKFCNGEVMGKKLKLGINGNTKSKKVRQRVSMSLTADIASEAKVGSSLSLSQEHSFINHTHTNIYILALLYITVFLVSQFSKITVPLFHA